jgi:hypothetical protein
MSAYHFFARQARREKLAATKAVTQPARERHLVLAARFAEKADRLRHDPADAARQPR